MSGRVATKPRRQSLREHFVCFVEGAAASRIDSEGGVLRDIKILGLKSANGRIYDAAAVRAALHLYEGAPVRVDHPRKADEPREADDVFGWLKNVRVAEDGSLRGDLHYLKSHPLASRVVEAAERNPRLYGLSHNIEAQCEQDGDMVRVVSIQRVLSCDLVADPATTQGLYENRNCKRQTMKLKAFLEALLPTMPADKQPVLKSLLEGDGEDMPMMDADMPVDAPAEGSDSGDWRKNLADVVGELAASDDAEAHDLAGKIMKLLKPESAEVVPPVDDMAMEEEGDEEEAPAEEPVEESCDDKKMESKKPSKASNPSKPSKASRAPDHSAKLKALTEQNRQATSTAAVLELLLETNLTFATADSRKAFIKALLPLSDSERRALVAERKELAEQARVTRQAPRSQSPQASAADEDFESTYRSTLQRLGVRLGSN